MAIGATSPRLDRHAGQRLELRLRFDVEAEDFLAEPEVHLGQGLADPGEDDPLSGNARRARPPQFSFADHVHAGAELSKRPSTA